MSTTTHCYYGADDDEADDDRVDRSREGPRVHGRGTDRTRCWAATVVSNHVQSLGVIVVKSWMVASDGSSLEVDDDTLKTVRARSMQTARSCQQKNKRSWMPTGCLQAVRMPNIIVGGVKLLLIILSRSLQFHK